MALSAIPTITSPIVAKSMQLSTAVTRSQHSPTRGDVIFRLSITSVRGQAVIVIDSDKRKCPHSATSWPLTAIVGYMVLSDAPWISPDILLSQPRRSEHISCTGRSCIVLTVHLPVPNAAHSLSCHPAVRSPHTRRICFVPCTAPNYSRVSPFKYTCSTTTDSAMDFDKLRNIAPSVYLAPSLSSFLSDMRTIGDEIYSSAFSTFPTSFRNILVDPTLLTGSPRLGDLMNRPQALLGKRAASPHVRSSDRVHHNTIKLDVLVSGRRPSPSSHSAQKRAAKRTRGSPTRPSRSIDVTEKTLSQIKKTLLHLHDPDDVEYAEDYYKHKMESERQDLKKWGRLSPGVTQGSWLTAIDYMLELHRRQGFWDSTLWIGADVLYRYLCLCSSDDLKRTTMKMLAAVALHIAANFHEMEVQSLWAYDGEFDVSECVKLERSILTTINYSLPLHSTPDYWLDLITAAGQMDNQSKDLARHLTLLTLRDHSFFKYSPRYKVAVAIYCSRRILHQGSWDSILTYFSGFRQVDLRTGCDKIVSIVSTTEKGNWVANRVESSSWTLARQWASSRRAY